MCSIVGMFSRSLALLLVSLVAVGCTAEASEEEVGETESQLATNSRRDGVVDQARRDRLVGEESTGYLGLVTGDARGAKRAPSDLAARIAHINIQRRALYTEVATKNGATVSDAAQTTACILFRDRVTVGEAYRTEDARWTVHTETAPVEMPSFCDR